MSVLVYKESFERNVRTGDTDAQKVSTYRKIKEAIAGGRIDDALVYIQFFDFEASIIYHAYQQWSADIERCLIDKGFSELDIKGIRKDMSLLVNTFVDPGKEFDMQESLIEYKMYQARLERELSGPTDVALATLDQWKEVWRLWHDRTADYVYGLMNVVCCQQVC